MTPSLNQEGRPGSRMLSSGGKNVNIAMAVELLLRQTSAEYVLLLEKDWVLIESGAEALRQLRAGLQAIRSGAAAPGRTPGPEPTTLSSDAAFICII
jgi:hypothetical protein